MAPLSRKAPGIRAATILVSAALLSRLPLFPSIDMVRAQHGGGGGDTIAWGLRLTTIADHLRYEGSWASHREITAFLVDASHPALLLGVASSIALGSARLARRVPLSVRARTERAVRHASVWAGGFFAIIVGLKGLLSLGLVRGPRPILLGLIGMLVLGVLAIAVHGRPAPWLRVAGRALITVILGVPLIAALLALFAIEDARHLPHVPYAWAAGLASFGGLAWLSTSARRRLLQTKLR